MGLHLRGGEGRGRLTCLPPRFDNPGYVPGDRPETKKIGLGLGLGLGLAGLVLCRNTMLLRWSS